MFQGKSGGHMVIVFIYKDHCVNVMVCEGENLWARPYR